MVNRMSTYVLTNRNRTNNNTNTRNAKHHIKSDTKNGQQRTSRKLPPWNVSNELQGGGGA